MTLSPAVPVLAEALAPEVRRVLHFVSPDAPAMNRLNAVKMVLRDLTRCETRLGLSNDLLALYEDLAPQQWKFLALKLSRSL